MRFNVVYHVATLNHWREVVEEQASILMRNVGAAGLFVTVGTESEQLAQACSALIDERIRDSGRTLQLQTLVRRLDEFEHPAMALIDNLARADDVPILYFHAKAVSYAPPNPLFEKWRRYLNQFIAEADGWSDLLAARLRRLRAPEAL
jgi:hypothetical protein